MACSARPDAHVVIDQKARDRRDEAISFQACGKEVVEISV